MYTICSVSLLIIMSHSPYYYCYHHLIQFIRQLSKLLISNVKSIIKGFFFCLISFVDLEIDEKNY